MEHCCKQYTIEYSTQYVDSLYYGKVHTVRVHTGDRLLNGMIANYLTNWTFVCKKCIVHCGTLFRQRSFDQAYLSSLDEQQLFMPTFEHHLRTGNLHQINDDIPKSSLPQICFTPYNIVTPRISQDLTEFSSKPGASHQTPSLDSDFFKTEL